jgi:Gpi18-like mannosyltransferase
MSDKQWRTLFVALAATVFLVKCYSALVTAGAPDIPLWERFLASIRENGAISTYYSGGLYVFPGGSHINPFNHPPFIAHYLRFVGGLSDLTGLPFRFWFRLLTSVADVGSALVLYRLLRMSGQFNPAAFLLYLLAPATIIISGYHGNTDTLMIFFLLLAIYLTQMGRPAWLCGIAFGMALNIKIVPIVAAPAFFFFLPDLRRRVEFVVVACLTFFVGSLPYIIEDPFVIYREVFGYRSIPTRWGVTRFLAGFADIHGFASIFFPFVRLCNYVLLAVLTVFSIKMNRKVHKPLLYVQVGTVMFLFMSFTLGYGHNYLSWLDPFAALAISSALLYYSASGTLLVYIYFINDDETTRWMDVCWLAVLVCTLLLLRVVRDRKEGRPTP